METVNIHDAKTRLSQLVARAAAGEPFIIARAGKPLVKVTRLDDSDRPKKRRLGMLEGKYTVPDDIKGPFRKEIEEMFYGDSDRSS